MKKHRDKYHPRSLFRLNNEGVPYKSYKGFTEQYVWLLVFIVSSILSLSSLLSHWHNILEKTFGMHQIFAGFIWALVTASIAVIALASVLSLFESIAHKFSIYAERTWGSCNLRYVLPKHEDISDEPDETILSLNVPMHVFYELQRAELTDFTILKKLEEYRYYDKKAQKTLDHIKKLPNISEDSVLIDDYQQLYKWYKDHAREVEKFIADRLSNKADKRKAARTTQDAIVSTVKAGDKDITVDDSWDSAYKKLSNKS
jgi:hypothetical protein